MIVNINHKVSCCVQQGVVIVDRGESRESQSVMSRLGRRGDSGHNLQGLVLCPGGRGDRSKGRKSRSVMLCLGRRGYSGHNLQGLVLCPGERGDSGQERITKYHVFRKARR